MKKISIAFILLIITLFPISAVTLRGTLDVRANTSGPIDEMAITNKDRITLFGYFPFGESIPMSITTEAFYEFGLSMPLTGDKELSLSHLVDLTALEFNMQFPIQETNVIDLSIGRIFKQDTTGLIFSQKLDGLNVQYKSNFFTINSHVGFTGFLNGHTTRIYGIKNKEILSEFYTFAPALIIANANFQLPYLIDGQHAFSADINAAIDITKNETKSNRFYLTAGLQGPIGLSFYYNVMSTLGYTMQTNHILSNLSSLELSAFLPFANTLLSWKTVFATGGAKNAFIPITEVMANIESSLGYSGYVKSGLVASMSPVNSLLLLLGTDVFFNVMDGANDKGYAGAQWNFATRWSIVSDVHLTASIASYFSNKPNTKPYLDASINLTITF